MAQPVLAQDIPPPADGNGDEVRIITPDMVDRDQSQILRRPPTQSAPDSQAGEESPSAAPSATSGETGFPSILAIFAHPDDEITVAPVLARAARTGGEVTIVFATSGDAGPGVTALEPGAELAGLREDEAGCSAFALGLSEPIFWRLGDGSLATMARAPDSAANDMAERIGNLIAIEQPDIVMTWGPDGGYGHADHRMVSNIVTQVVQAMGEGRPDLLYPVLPASSEGEQKQIPGFEGWARIDPSLATDRLRYELLDLESTRIAVDCYQSQFDPSARAYLPEMLHREIWQGSVYFRLVFPKAERPPEVQN
ncbi:PIG-L family deacetylase [uncultured Erythrobacter sp.]|uniref:PIG-L family deacetylase n=1 Tax=uncultured Erythrobacter sp. TaxID=263913 RepID=UPI0026234523|nr:PIG-L family deacetylase [uncultured Erythrobacter sp.]